jgi:hypothetical protein
MYRNESTPYVPNPQEIANLSFCGTRMKDGSIMIENDEVLSDFPKAIAACKAIYTLRNIEPDDEAYIFDGALCGQCGIYEYDAEASQNKIAAYKPLPFELSGFHIRGNRLESGEVKIGNRTFKAFPEKVDVCDTIYSLDCVKRGEDDLEFGVYCIKPVSMPMMSGQEFLDTLFGR